MQTGECVIFTIKCKDSGVSVSQGLTAGFMAFLIEQNGMKRPRFKHRAIISGLLLITLGLVGWPLWQEVKQQQLNRRLLQAIQQHNDTQALVVLRTGASPNAQDSEPILSLWTILQHRIQPVSVVKYRSKTALMYAADRSSPLLVHTLLSRGADVNARDEAGRTALDFAIKDDIPNLEIIRALLAKGANVNQRVETGETPLFDAAWKKQPDVVQLLLDYGALVNLRSDEGTILYQLYNDGLTAKLTEEETQRFRRVCSILGKAGAKE